MFRGEGAIHLVVRAHHRPGLGLLDSLFKRRQIDLAQRAFVHLGANAEALELLVVSGIVFERGTHSFGLNPTDDAGRHFPGQIGILGEIFKVAPTQR